METLFRLDSDLLSAELTGQAASLLTEKFSFNTGKVAKEKLISFSRPLQHWLPGEESNQEKENQMDLQKKVLNEILQQNGQVDYYLDFLEDVHSSWQSLDDHELPRAAVTAILKAHSQQRHLWEKYLSLANYDALYEENRDVLTPGRLKIFLEIESSHESLSFMTSTVSLIDHSIVEASDYLANYGFCLTTHELFCLTFVICSSDDMETVEDNYEKSLDWLSKYPGTSVTAATLIVLAQKLIESDTLALDISEYNCLRHMFTHNYPQYGGKIEALETLGFHLLRSIRPSEALEFCKNAQFWSGYLRYDPIIVISFEFHK